MGKKMIPPNVPQAARAWVISQLIEQGLWRDDKVTRMCVVGVRSYYTNTMGKRGVNDRGIYDDAIFVITPTGMTAFNGNTDPSVYRKGRAVLKAPQKVKYRKGWHGYRSKRGHKAFRQASNVIVKRDGGVGNGKSLGGGYYTDKGAHRFWINLHRGGWTTTSSAGCQTVPPSQWGAFYSLVCLEMDRYKQSSFNYYLINR